jgi:TRAP-type mannitol/chloroaromatic compound transport system substrate-binding protein
MPGKIFVNYRRDDDPNGAARVRDGLASKFGKSSVFMDVDNLLAGQRFDEELAKALAQCDVLLAVIGPRWMEILKARMASGERDYVQEEIAEALKRKLVVIPVLVGRDRQMPSVPRRDDLPEDIRDLVLYQKHDVAHERFGRDIAELIAAIVTIRKTNRPQLAASRGPARWVAATAVSVLAIGYAWAHYSGVPVPWPGGPPAGTEATDAAKTRADEAEVKRLRAEAEARQKADLEAKKAAEEAERQRAAAEAKRRGDEEAARRAQPIPSTSNAPVVRNERRFRLASSYPKSLTAMYVPGVEFVEDLRAISGSKLTAQVFAAGEIVPGLAVLDAVKSGTVEMGWTYAGYYYGSEPALAVVAGGTPLGKSARAYLAWLQGEGRVPRDELFASLGVKALPCSMVGPLGLWVKKPLNNVSDLNGMKLRLGGAIGQAMAKHGVVPQQIAGGEIYTALERGTIDGAQWLTPSMDELLGFYKIARYYYYPFGEPTFSYISDLVIGLSLWKSLEPAARDAIELACSMQLAKDSEKLLDGASEALKKFAEYGVSVRRVPEPLAAALQRSAVQTADMTITSGVGLAVWRSLKNAR